MIMYCYKNCSTCKKAEKFLAANNIDVEIIDYTEHPITKENLEKYYEKSGLNIDKFFNTSGLVYRDLHLKGKLPTMDSSEKFDLLASNPMLVKRPFLVGADFVLLGFKEKDWEAHLLNK